jgi:hypothetical protein
VPTDKRRTKVGVRTRRALTAEQEETIEVASSLSMERVMQDFVNAKVSERTAERTIRDYLRHFRYMHDWLLARYPEIRIAQVTTTTMLREYISRLQVASIRYPLVAASVSKRPSHRVTKLRIRPRSCNT